MQKSHITRIILTILTMASFFVSYVKAEVKGPVVIVSSYNPSEARMKTNIEQFCERYESRGGDGSNIRI